MHITQGDLPHWHMEGRIYFVTFRLADSLPATATMEYKKTISAWQDVHGRVLTTEEAKELEKLKLQVINSMLDRCLGRCMLKTIEARKLVEHAFHHFDHSRYHIHDYVIMPNHVHIILQPIDNFSIQSVVSSLKSYTAHGLNKLLNAKGKVWQSESFDRIIRNEHHYWKVVDYIARNPRGLLSNEYSLYLTNGSPDFKPMPNYAILR